MIGRYWLPALLVGLAIFVVGGFLGARAGAASARRPRPTPCIARTRSRATSGRFDRSFCSGSRLCLAARTWKALGVDPYGFDGHPGLGWKMAFCERDLAIYVGLLLAGVFFARRRDLSALGLGCVRVVDPADGDRRRDTVPWLAREHLGTARRHRAGLRRGERVAPVPARRCVFRRPPLVGRYAADTACAPQPPRG